MGTRRAEPRRANAMAGMGPRVWRGCMEAVCAVERGECLRLLAAWRTEGVDSARSTIRTKCPWRRGCGLYDCMGQRGCCPTGWDEGMASVAEMVMHVDVDHVARAPRGPVFGQSWHSHLTARRAHTRPPPSNLFSPYIYPLPKFPVHDSPLYLPPCDRV